MVVYIEIQLFLPQKKTLPHKDGAKEVVREEK